MNSQYVLARLLSPESLVFILLILIALASIFSGMMINIAKIVRGDDKVRKEDREIRDRQSTSIDELWIDMDRMEKRIQNLETILMARDEKKK